MAWGDGDGEGMQEDPKKVRLTHAVGQCGSVSMACPFRARLLVRRLASAVRSNLRRQSRDVVLLKVPCRSTEVLVCPSSETVSPDIGRTACTHAMTHGACTSFLGFLLNSETRHTEEFFIMKNYIAIEKLSGATPATRGFGFCRRLPASPGFAQASLDEQIKHIIRKLHAVFVQPQHQQDKLMGGNVEHQVIFARPIDDIPDFDRPVVRTRDNLGPVRGKRHRRDCLAVGVRLLAQQPQRVCQTSQQASVLAKKGRFEGAAHPNPRL